MRAPKSSRKAERVAGARCWRAALFGRGAITRGIPPLKSSLGAMSVGSVSEQPSETFWPSGHQKIHDNGSFVLEGTYKFLKGPVTVKSVHGVSVRVDEERPPL